MTSASPSEYQAILCLLPGTYPVPNAGAGTCAYAIVYSSTHVAPRSSKRLDEADNSRRGSSADDIYAASGLQLFLCITVWVLVVVLPTNLAGHEVTRLQTSPPVQQGFAYWLSPPPPARAGAPPAPEAQVKAGPPSQQCRWSVA